MTEAEWLACTDSTPMLEFLRSSRKLSDRKWRLFAVACCRLFPDCLAVDAARAAVETSERYADGQANGEDLSRARSAAHDAGWKARGCAEGQPTSPEDTARGPERPTEELVRRLFFIAFMTNTSQRLRSDDMPMLRTDPLLVRSSPLLLRDVVANPFRPPPAVDPSSLAWGGGTVPRLAAAAYEGRALPSGVLDAARLAVLADALEEAGCDNADIQGHLRGPGPHVRGCWCVDLILCKE
jgi:hypothetical protein